MGLIYNGNVEETEIYQAYGLTVYGKINRYIWAIYGDKEENALITFRIADADGNDIFSMYMGNNCILQCRIDDTLDNFLWWIAENHPDTYTIERQVFSSLCSGNCLFNHSIENRKFKKRREEEERKRHEEHKKQIIDATNSINDYGNKNELIPCFIFDKVYLIKANSEDVTKLFKTADNKHLESIIGFIEEHPDNKDASVIKSGTMEEILNYIKQNGGK